MPGRVVVERRVWLATACPTLFEENDAIRVGVEKAAIVGDQSGPWPTVQKHNGLAVRSAALFVIELMNRRDADVSAVVWFDFRIKGS